MPPSEPVPLFQHVYVSSGGKNRRKWRHRFADPGSESSFPEKLSAQPDKLPPPFFVRFVYDETFVSC